jgi:hypothetical protein
MHCVLLIFCRMENQPCWMSRIGMKFDSVGEAWDFWVAYCGIVGFDARKQYNNKRKTDGVPTSSRFVCANAGFREKDSRDHLTKHPRAETRTCCKVRMSIILNREEGNYKLNDLVLEHNHILQLPCNMPSNAFTTKFFECASLSN